MATWTQCKALHLIFGPCGDPTIENQLWKSLRGKVTKVIDGRTIVVDLAAGQNSLRAYLVGVALGSEDSEREQAKSVLSKILLEKSVEILVSPSWDTADKNPTEVAGVVYVEKKTIGDNDAGLSLLSNGLVKFQEPAPYSMSRFTECEYKRAETEAQSKKMGVWAKRPATN